MLRPLVSLFLCGFAAACSSSGSLATESAAPDGSAGSGGSDVGLAGSGGAVAGTAGAGPAAGSAGAGLVGSAGTANGGSSTAGASGQGGSAGSSPGGSAQGGAATGGGGSAGAKNPSIDHLQVVVKVGDQVGDGTDNPVKLCLSSGGAHCYDLANDWIAGGSKHDDFVRGVREHFDLAPNDLRRDDIELVSLNAGTGDPFKVECLAVVADGELVYCKDDLKVSIGTAASPTWKDTSLETSCGSCYRKGSPITHGPLVGYTTKTSTSIWLRAGSSVPVRIRYGTGAGLGSSKLSDPVTPKQSDDFTVVVPLDGLEAGTTYFYTPVVNGKDTIAQDYPSFTTAPPSPEEFTVAFGSCSNWEAIKGNPVTLEEFPTAFPVYDEIRKFTTKPSANPRGPDMMLLIGDNHYGNTWSRRGHDFFYRESRDQPQFARVIANVPTLAVWDDHDFGTNNSDGAEHTGQRDGVLAAFDDYWANAPEGATVGGKTVPGIWHRASWGGVDFFLLDDRYYRESGAKSQPDAALLGPDQIAWLVDALASSKAKFKLVASGSMWSSNAAPGPNEDTWASHPDELAAIVGAIRNKKIDGVVLLSGDKHRSAVYRFRAAQNGHPPIYELMSSGLSGAENACIHTAFELLCVDFHGPTYGRMRFKMGLADPVLTYEIGGPQFGVWKDSFTIKASELVDP